MTEVDVAFITECRNVDVINASDTELRRRDHKGPIRFKQNTLNFEIV